MKARDAVPWLLLVVGTYAVYRLMQGLNKKKDEVVDTVADFWFRLTSRPPIEVLGSVRFPDGTLVPLSSLTVKTDASQNVFTQRAGHVYQLQPHDATGNWPAILVK